MFETFAGQTADEVWQEIAGAMQHGPAREQLSRSGPTVEILHATIAIADPRARWVVSRVPSINPAFAIAETVWILTGRNDANFLNYFNSALPSYAGCGPTYHGAYGYRLRHHLGIDQLDRAYQALRQKPISRQVVLQLWDSTIDLPCADGTEASPDVPCNVFSMLKVRSGRLEWTQVLRSNDVFRGLPYNFIQFTTLQEIMAGWLNLEVGSFNMLSDSLHVYEDDVRHLSSSLPIEVAVNADFLALSKPESEQAYSELAKNIDFIIEPTTSVSDLTQLTSHSRLPRPYANMLCILAAEGARRRRCCEAASEIMAICVNPIYRQLYDRWHTRFVKSSS